MAEDRVGTPGSESQTYWAWTELFRTFQVALDPKKLILAGAGIVIMWLGWAVLSYVFFQARAKPVDADFQPATYESRGLSTDDAKKKAAEEFAAALARYQMIFDLAGPGGAFRIEPWHEHRGPNPFQLAT